MLWIKDGKLFDGRLELDGKVMFIAGDPDPELMRRGGVHRVRAARACSARYDGV